MAEWILFVESYLPAICTAAFGFFSLILVERAKAKFAIDIQNILAKNNEKMEKLKSDILKDMKIFESSIEDKRNTINMLISWKNLCRERLFDRMCSLSNAEN